MRRKIVKFAKTRTILLIHINPHAERYAFSMWHSGRVAMYADYPYQGLSPTREIVAKKPDIIQTDLSSS